MTTARLYRLSGFALVLGAILAAVSSIVSGVVCQGCTLGWRATAGWYGSIGTLANAFGAILMGIPMITKQVYPRWCGYMLMVEAVLAVASFFVRGPGPTTTVPAGSVAAQPA